MPVRIGRQWEARSQQEHAPAPSDQDPSQDVVSPREDTSRHGQVTADKWNQ